MSDRVPPRGRRRGRKLRVWGGSPLLDSATVARLGLPETPHNQFRCIVAATTKKGAAAMVGCKVGYFNAYWCETGNAVELSIATRVGVWYAPLNGRTAEDYREARPSYAD